MLKNFELDFNTALSAVDASKGKFIKHHVSIAIPEDLIETLAARYVTILLQSQMRSGSKEYGTLKYGKWEMYYRHTNK